MEEEGALQWQIPHSFVCDWEWRHGNLKWRGEGEVALDRRSSLRDYYEEVL